MAIADAEKEQKVIHLDEAELQKKHHQHNKTPHKQHPTKQKQ